MSMETNTLRQARSRWILDEKPTQVWPIEERITEKEHPDAWASQILACPMKHARQRLKMTPVLPELLEHSDDTLMLFETGNQAEITWANILAHSYPGYQRQVPLRANGISGVADGLLPDGAYVEVKWSGQRGVQASHVAQLACYLYMGDVPHGYLIVQGPKTFRSFLMERSPAGLYPIVDMDEPTSGQNFPLYSVGMLRQMAEAHRRAYESRGMSGAYPTPRKSGYSCADKDGTVRCAWWCWDEPAQPSYPIEGGRIVINGKRWPLG